MQISSASSHLAAAGPAQASTSQADVAKQQLKQQAIEGREDIQLIKSAAPPRSMDGTGIIVNVYA